MSNGQSALRPGPVPRVPGTASSVFPAPDGRQAVITGPDGRQAAITDPDGPVPAARFPGDADDALLARALAALGARPRPIRSPVRLPQAILGLAASEGGPDHVTRPPAFPYRGADPDAGGWS